LYYTLDPNILYKVHFRTPHWNWLLCLWVSFCWAYSLLQCHDFWKRLGQFIYILPFGFLCFFPFLPFLIHHDLTLFSFYLRAFYFWEAGSKCLKLY
jgi:hypothetical protein